MSSDVDWAFAQYEKVRGVLPSAVFPVGSVTVSGLMALVDHIDVFLLDAFGVLNVGDTVISGAPECVAALQSMGKQVFVVTNSASLPPDVFLAKYRGMGFDFTTNDVIASRDALAVGMRARDERRWGVAALDQSRLEELPDDCVALADDLSVYDDVEGFILLGAAQWSNAYQDMLVDALRRNPRPVLVGNPDIVAPRETGLSLEPGWYAHDLAARLDVAPDFFGKPFGNVFELALAKIDSAISRDRIAMVGDTLHTDILGGANIGVKTVLVTDHGLFSGRDVQPYITQSGIVPNWIVESI